MDINEKTAQLILDAIAWCNMDWMTTLGDTDYSDETVIEEARNDFVRFCKARGIEGIVAQK